QHQVVLNRVDGQLHQVAAIVKRTHLYIGRQEAAVQILGLRFHSLQHILGLFAAPHQDHAFDRVVNVVEAELPQTRRVPDDHLADVADVYGHAILRAHDDVPDVIGVADQADAANIIKLSTLRIETAAGVGVVGGQLL